jgi:putative transposase
MQNGYVEGCNGSLRRELLNAYLFQTLDEVRHQTELWRQDYNEKRPHKSLGYVPPAEYKRNPDPVKLEKSNAKN